MSLVPGSRLDAYEIVRPLGSGGMGEVWLATEVRLGRKVALKVLPSDLTQDPLRVQRFEQEARAASALNHPNVCTILALGQTSDGQHYIAMEYVEGETLRQRLSTARLTIRESLDVAIQVAAALSTAHAAGIVHRDIKPENVMLRPDGFVKVLDFGLAKLAPAGPKIAGGDTTQTVLKTEAGVVVGTAAYMSPEQARGQDVDARTDVWSLGVMLYEMVAGRSPFAGPTRTDTLAAILDREPPPLARFEPDAPQELHRIAMKALRKARDVRYQTVKDLQLDLQALREGLSAPTYAPNQVLTPPLPTTDGAERASGEQTTTRRRPNAQRIGLGMAVLLLLVVGSLWTWRQSSSTTHQPLRSNPKLVRLTANPSSMGITFPYISPDGHYLAFSDRNGIQVRLIDTGETQRLPDTKGMQVYGWSPDSAKVLGFSCDGDSCVGWNVSLIGNSRYKTAWTWPVGDIVMSLPDGSGLLRLHERELRFDRADGSPVKLITANMGTVSVPISGDHTLFGTAEDKAIMRAALPDGTPTEVWHAPKGWIINDLLELTDRRIIVSVESDAGNALCELHTDSAGRVSGEPVPLTEWMPEESLAWPSASSDAKRVAFLRSRTQGDVYVADMDERAGTLSTARRLTLDDRNDFATAWTPDSRAILFASTRNGDSDIFRQSLLADTPEPVATGAGDQSFPRVADGRWLLYSSIGTQEGERLMRTTLAGGRGEPVSPIIVTNAKEIFSYALCTPRALHHYRYEAIGGDRIAT